jgi:hypothetical protein
MKNWKLQLNLKMLKDELNEERTFEKLGCLSQETSSLAAGEPSIEPKETTQTKETREVVVQTTYLC